MNIKKWMISSMATVLLTMLGNFTFAQSTIKGNIKSGSEALSGATINLKGTSITTFTDAKGNFTLFTTAKPPYIIEVVSSGFETQTITINDAAEMVNASMKAGIGNDIVVSATRTPTRLLESPVSIERLSAAAIRNAPASSYYDAIGALKGVDITTSSLTFKTPSTRGFNGSGNARFNQIVDGMDNQAPGLNFSAGAIIGLSELDVDNVELLPGASSALYGPGGMNGTLLINSKSPFKQQGLSFQVKQGIMNTDRRYRNTSPFVNWDFRYAKKVSEKFAFKFTGEFIHAKDWVGSDTLNYRGTGALGSPTSGTRASDPNYNGVNTYGDETTADIRAVFAGIGNSLPFLQPFLATLSTQPVNVSRTGYKEVDLVNPNTVNFKVGGSLNYKITPGVEAILQGYFGTGNTVYTGSDRYSLKELKVAQYKLEFKAKDWYVRAYTTQENSGESFNTTITTRLTNEALRPSSVWYPTYGQTFVNQKLNGATDAAAHAFARTTADAGMPGVKTAAFKAAFDRVRSTPIGPKNGGLFLDKTDLYNIEGQYNLSSLVADKAEIVVGGNYKIYNLNSQGTLFADTAGPIKITEAGAYAQIAKKFLDDKLKISVSGRFDKNNNFAGKFTPRATAVYKIASNNNVRVSYQQAYRFPTTQQQFINLVVGGATLVGGVPSFRTFYNFDTKPVFQLSAAGVPSATAATFGEFKPESLSSIEAGYKGLHANKKLLIDVYGYYGQYKDFLVRNNYRQPATGTIFSVPTNNSTKVTTYGWGLSLDYRLPNNFSIGGNVSSDKIENAPINSGFNTPPIRTNITFANSGFGMEKRYGFNVVYKFQDKFYYESDFMSGGINAIHTLDAQVSYKLLKEKSIIKIGATNLLNQYYVNAMGNPSVGGLYYVSFGFNVF